MCRCRCSKCTQPSTRSIDTQTDTTQTRVKHIQVQLRTSVKSVTVQPKVAHKETSVDLATGDQDTCTDVEQEHPLMWPDDLTITQNVHSPSSPSPSSSSSSSTRSPNSTNSTQPDSLSHANLEDDPDYVPTDPEMKHEVGAKTGADNSPDTCRKFIVFESNLTELFDRCPRCGAKTHKVKLDVGSRGTLLKVNSGVWLKIILNLY